MTNAILLLKLTTIRLTFIISKVAVHKTSENFLLGPFNLKLNKQPNLLYNRLCRSFCRMELHWPLGCYSSCLVFIYSEKITCKHFALFILWQNSPIWQDRYIIILGLMCYLQFWSKYCIQILTMKQNRSSGKCLDLIFYNFLARLSKNSFRVASWELALSFLKKS